MGTESSWRGARAKLLAATAAALSGLAIATPVLAAGSWWQAAASSSPELSAIASASGTRTLAISGGTPGWYWPGSGRFRPVVLGPAVVHPGPVAALATAGGAGVVAFADGRLLLARASGRASWRGSVPGRPRAVALGAAGRLAVASSAGLYQGVLGRRLRRAVPGDAQAVLAPPRRGLDWVALVAGRLWRAAGDGPWAPWPGAPPFDPATRALAELGSGVVMVAEPGGLVWRGSGRSWSEAFQVLPYGGLGGVPRVTALTSDGLSSAYLATRGFGTLLTPDGGYTWYRAAPPDSAVRALAVVGPVFTAHPHGILVALAGGRTYLHRLQALPAPPVYTPTGQAFELAGTAAVTGAAALLVLLALGYWGRRRQRRSV